MHRLTRTIGAASARHPLRTLAAWAVLAVVGSASDAPTHGRAVAALDRLPADQRLVLVLKYVDEMTVAEVARELGRSVHATESLLARARTALRAAVDQEVQQ